MRSKNPIFKFKQFNIDQTGCAMKVNTDGVLLACAAYHYGAKSILDIGTGTGVIALMLAQRFLDAYIDAVEIDRQSAETAALNAGNSIFSSRIKIFNIPFQEYNTEKKYDLIISNPPFFVNDLKSDEKRKELSRHTDADFFLKLIDKSAELLKECGELWLILPIKLANDVIEIALNYNLSLIERISIHSDKNKAAFRCIICLSSKIVELKENDFYIYESQGQHTTAYKLLLKDFFLNF